MKIQFASDLHIEFPENNEYFRRNMLKPVGDILVLGGDIVPFRQTDEHRDFFDYLSDNFSITYWIPGNHEYYHSDITERSHSLDEKIRDNIRLVDNISVMNGNVRMIFSTLWTKIGPSGKEELQIAYSDFRAILHDGLMLTVANYNSAHEECLSFLKEELSRPGDDPVVVVTHHMPTFLNYPEEYRSSPLSDAFAVELSAFINETQPDYWIFGHYHNISGDFSIGKTRLVSNQLGYVMYNEHRRFDPGKFIEI